MTDIPKAAKKPADRKPKAEKADEAPSLISAELLGQTWRVDADALDDFELLDDLAALQNDQDVTRIPSALRRLLGQGDYKRALDALRDEKGKVRVEPAAEFMMELIGALDPNS